MILMVIRNTVFKMIEIWQHHAKKDMQKRLASVHSTIVRGRSPSSLRLCGMCNFKVGLFWMLLLNNNASRNNS